MECDKQVYNLPILLGSNLLEGFVFYFLMTDDSLSASASSIDNRYFMVSVCSSGEIMIPRKKEIVESTGRNRNIALIQSFYEIHLVTQK